MKQFCKYRNILGKPNEGFHKTRLFGFALYDIIGAFLLAYFLTVLTGMSDIKAIVIVFIVTVFLHWLFCVNTKLNVMIFGKR